MNSLSALLTLLDNADRKLFKAFLQQKNKRNDVKNLRLLNLIETDDISNANKLYKSAKNKDAYHALRKRLQDSLLLFLSRKTFERNQSGAYEALRLLVVGRFLLENDMPAIAFKSLEKAERLATSLEQFNMLNELLLLKLQYAHVPGAEDLDVLTKRFMQNQSAMQCEAKLNMAYAFLRQELQQIHLKWKVVNLSSLMVSVIRKYKISRQDLMTFKSIYQILFIANEYAAIQQNYRLIARYIAQTDQFIQKLKVEKHSYLFYHIGILYFMANFYLRIGDFSKSIAYLDKMTVVMKTDERHHAQYYLRHQLLVALNCFFAGDAPEAIRVLQQSLSVKKQASKPEDVEDLRICLAMVLAMCNNRDSVKQLTLLAHTDAWYEKHMGMLWTIRKTLMEILIQAQFSNIDQAMSRISSFRRRYKKYLLKTGEGKVLLFLKLVEQHLLKPDVIFDMRYRTKVQSLLSGPESNDIFTRSFIAWLVACWEKKTPHEIVLQLLKNMGAASI
ncbi:tetratricopeptide repeat protein [Mucilaginibacter defluvii]|uniref:Tetratricopeptide repeat protein n=1 Tax=Mucilaginibacter defluvii TaxID=1196019 RepID=A0ABP9G7I8_9SPHI